MFKYELIAENELHATGHTNVLIEAKPNRIVPWAEFLLWVHELKKFIDVSTELYPEVLVDKELFVQFKNTEDKFDCELTGWNLEVIKLNNQAQVAATPRKQLTLAQLTLIGNTLVKWSN